MNTEGRPQLAMRQGLHRRGQGKLGDLRALSAELDATLPYDSLAQLRQAMVAAHPHLAGVDQVAKTNGSRLVQANWAMRRSATRFPIST